MPYAFRNPDGTTITVRAFHWPETKLSDGTGIRPGDAGVTAELLAAIGAELVVQVHPTVDPATEIEDGYTDTLIADVPTRTWSKRALTQLELDAIADNVDRDAKAVSIGQAVDWLRTHAATAAGVTVTSGNAVNVLQTVVADLAVFLDGFADLIEGRRFDN